MNAEQLIAQWQKDLTETGSRKLAKGCGAEAFLIKRWQAATSVESRWKELTAIARLTQALITETEDGLRIHSEEREREQRRANKRRRS